MDFFLVNRVFFYVLGVITFFGIFYFFFISPPANFPVGTVFKVEQGDNLRIVSLKLKNADLIRSRIVFETLVIIFGGEKKLLSSDYYFKNKLSIFEIALRMSKGEYHMAPVVVTIPEGFDISQIADAFASKLMNFNKVEFLLETKGLKGKLFPDTYFFLTTDTEKNVIKSMNANFKKKILTLKPEIIRSLKSEQEIITMASVIEKEAKGDIDRGIISGILWKRLSIGMPLQVDSAPETYQTKGLPKEPVCSPGLASIKAAIYPQNSPYLYYLHDKNGNIHYAKSFTEHRKNVLKYLK
jgi:UPF0755 protein